MSNGCPMKYLLRHERQFWVGRCWGRFKQTDTFTTATHNRTTGYSFRIVRSIPAKSTNRIPYTDSILGDFQLRHNSIFIVVFIPEARTSQSHCAHFSANTTSHEYRWKIARHLFCVANSHFLPDLPRKPQHNVLTYRSGFPLRASIAVY